MPRLQRMGDSNDAGGVITDIPQSSVFCNGKLVSIDGSIGTSHIPRTLPHLSGIWTTASGVQSVRIGGVPVNVEDNSDSCGHKRVDGSGNVFAGGG